MRFTTEYIRRIKKILRFYGDTHQKHKAVEELNELTVELKEDLESTGSIDNILQETADVYVMLEQIACIYGFTMQEILEVAQIKIDRQLDRIEKEVHPDITKKGKKPWYHNV